MWGWRYTYPGERQRCLPFGEVVTAAGRELDDPASVDRLDADPDVIGPRRNLRNIQADVISDGVAVEDHAFVGAHVRVRNRAPRIARGGEGEQGFCLEFAGRIVIERPALVRSAVGGVDIDVSAIPVPPPATSRTRPAAHSGVKVKEPSALEFGNQN